MLRRLKSSLACALLLAAAPERPAKVAHLPLAASSWADAMKSACAWTRNRRDATVSPLKPCRSSLPRVLRMDNTSRSILFRALGDPLGPVPERINRGQCALCEPEPGLLSYDMCKGHYCSDDTIVEEGGDTESRCLPADYG